MTPLFLKLLNMSIAASYLVLAVMLIRALFRKMPKWISCLMWSLVGLRLVLPFSFESKLSQIPSAEVIPEDILLSEAPAIHSGIPAVNDVVNPLLTQQSINGEHLLETIISVASVVWLAGVGIMLLYSLCAWLRLHWQVRVSVRLRENIYRCDRVRSPFLLGVFRPRIYLPSDISEEACEYVLSHEKAHIRRKDHLWKPFGFFLLTIYWFNPLLWIGYILLCRDIERACDEKVVSKKDSAYRLGYAEALVDCSVHRRLVMACPVAFGEVSVKSRVKRVLHYKKPALWLVLVSVVLCGITAFCFLSNPKTCPHLYTGTTRLPATCTEMGLEDRTCIFCKYSYTAPVAALSHSYDEGVITREPNCVRTGVRTMTCARCQNIQKETVPATGIHTIQEVELCASTCSKEGTGLQYCINCPHEKTCTYDALPHTLVTTMHYDATCTINGIDESVCTVCNTKQETILRCSGKHEYIGDQSDKYYTCKWCSNTKANKNYVAPQSTSSVSIPTTTSTYDTLYKITSRVAEDSSFSAIIWDRNGNSSPGY